MHDDWHGPGCQSRQSADSYSHLSGNTGACDAVGLPPSHEGRLLRYFLAASLLQLVLKNGLSCRVTRVLMVDATRCNWLNLAAQKTLVAWAATVQKTKISAQLASSKTGSTRLMRLLVTVGVKWLTSYVPLLPRKDLGSDHRELLWPRWSPRSSTCLWSCGSA